MMFFSLWMMFVSRDAILFLHIFNVIGIICCIGFYFYVEESPKWFISKA
jgi:hypothetical protein